MNKKAEARNNNTIFLAVLVGLILLAIAIQSGRLNLSAFSISSMSGVSANSCRDSDGADIFTVGSVYANGQLYEDQCINGRVYETQCAEDGTPIALLNDCPPTTFCDNGACGGNGK